MKKNPHHQPDSFSYNTIIKAKLLKHLVATVNGDKYDYDSDADSVDNSLKRSEERDGCKSLEEIDITLKQAIEECFEIFAEMKGIKRRRSRPNVYTYNLLLNGLSLLARQGDDSAVDR